jgi:hypothetical protein
MYRGYEGPIMTTSPATTYLIPSARTDTVAPWKGTSPISSMTRGTRDRADPVYRR